MKTWLESGKRADASRNPINLQSYLPFNQVSNQDEHQDELLTLVENLVSIHLLSYPPFNQVSNHGENQGELLTLGENLLRIRKAC